MEETTNEPTVVVGVDGSPANRSAVDYAVDLALSLGSPLRLLSAYVDMFIPMTGHQEDVDAGWVMLADVERESLRGNPELRVSTDPSGAAMLGRC